MPKQAWTFAGIFTALLVIGVLGLSSWEKSQRLKDTQKELEAARAAVEQAAAQAGEVKNQLAQTQSRIEQLQQEKDAVAQVHKGLEEEMREALESKEVTISELQGKLTVNILDRILFDSGEAVLKPDGAKVLEQIASVLAQYPKRQIHVVGHTDNVPIRAAARARFASNWELSMARATAAVRFLSDKAGVDPKRMGAVGYGEFRPIADNATPEGRARNRRIAVVILSDELAGSDAVPTVVPVATPAAVPTGAATASVTATNPPPEVVTNGVPAKTQ